MLRWLSDHYGPNFAGGEQEFQQALIDNNLAGFENIEPKPAGPRWPDEIQPYDDEELECEGSSEEEKMPPME